MFVDLGAVFLDLDEGDDFDICKVLQNQMVPEPVQGNKFCTAKNAAISKVLTDCVLQLKLFTLILWHRIYELLGDHLSSNEDEVVRKGMLRKPLTDRTHHLYVDVIGSVEYHRELHALFQVDDLSEAHLSLGSMSCLNTFTFFYTSLGEQGRSSP